MARYRFMRRVSSSAWLLVNADNGGVSGLVCPMSYLSVENVWKWGVKRTGNLSFKDLRSHALIEY